MLLSGNFRSVKMLFITFRLDTNNNVVVAKYMSARSNPIQTIGSWSNYIARFKVHQQKVVGSVETFVELQKAFHNFNSLDGHGVYTKAFRINVNEGYFVIGVALNHFGGKSSVSDSGVDISTSTCYL